MRQCSLKTAVLSYYHSEALFFSDRRFESTLFTLFCSLQGTNSFLTVFPDPELLVSLAHPCVMLLYRGELSHDGAHARKYIRLCLTTAKLSLGLTHRVAATNAMSNQHPTSAITVLLLSHGGTACAIIKLVENTAYHLFVRKVT